MRLTLAATVLALGWAASAWANDWGFMATISNTMGIQPNRLCMGEGSRGDIGCPAYAPQVLSSGLLSTTNISASGAIEGSEQEQCKIVR